MPQQDWYQTQVNGEWYKTQAASLDEARAKIQGHIAAQAQVNQAIRTVPRPQPPEAGFFDQATDLLTSLHVTPFGSSAMFDPRRLPTQEIMRRPDPAAQWLGGPREVTEGVEQMAEPEAEEKKLGAARAGYGAFQTATPLMAAGLVEAPVAMGLGLLGTEVGTRGGTALARAAGWSPGSQALAGLAGGGVLGMLFGGGEFYRERYNALVEEAKVNLRNTDAFKVERGSTTQSATELREKNLQQAAEFQVQRGIAEGNTFPNLSIEARDALIRAAQQGLFLPRDKTLEEKFGRDAQAAPPETSQHTQPGYTPQPTPEAQTVEAQTRPLTQVEKVEQLAKPPETLAPQESVQDRLRKIKEQVGYYDTKQQLRLREEEPKAPPTPLEKKQAAMRERQETAKADTLAGRDAIEAARQQNKVELEKLRIEREQLRPETPPSPEVGREPAPTPAAEPKAESVQAAQPTEGRGEPVRTPEGPSLGDLRGMIAKELVESKKADKKSANSLADHILSNEKAANDVAASPAASEKLKLLIKLAQTTADMLKKKQEETAEAERTRPGSDNPQAIQEQMDRIASQPKPTGMAEPRVSLSDYQQRVELQRQLVERMQQDPKYKGVAKARLQEIAAEQIRKQRGAFGGGGPEDVRARREEKINNWINQLRDPKTDPKDLDNAFKMLRAYGLKDEEILAKVKREVPAEPAGEGFAIPKEKPPFNINAAIDKVDQVMQEARVESIAQQRMKPEESRSVQEIIRDPEALVEGRAVGEPEVKGVLSPSRAELERMFNLKDERGFWRMWPAKKAKPVGPGTGTAIEALTQQMESALRAMPPTDQRLKFSERLDKTLTEGWDEVQLTLGKLAGHAAALRDSYLRPPLQTDYHTALGRFSGALNRNAVLLRDFTNTIKKQLPDQRQREAITNWMQAGGDDTILAQRAARSKGYVRAAYERARTLTPEEIGYAKMYEAHFDRRLNEAIKLDILDHGIENYVPQVWKGKDQTSAMNFFSSIGRSGLLKPDFNAAKKRIFDSYFEGEQAGYKPVNKDIGFLISSWERAFNQAIASKNLIFELSNGTAEDGRPILAPAGKGKRLFDSGSQSPLATEPPAAYLIYPKALSHETGDYRAIDHPALTKWVWTASDDNGAPIFMKGDLRVHPKSAYKDASGNVKWTKDYASMLDNTVNRGKWAQQHPIQVALLKGQGFFKATLLTASPFHQIQEGTHALFHKVNPFSPPEINLADPSLNKLLDRGLVIGNYDPVAAFDEGLTSGSGGALGKIPGFGEFMQKYSDYLFGSYIPRLKAKMATEAFERNLKRFDKAIQAGKITSDQVAEITANQANAAFGELNYIMMGRHPQTQAIMRFMFLAPDFLEARARFAGQAFSPLGREQQAALIRGALGLYIGFRILNKLFDDDYHWDRPFSFVVGGYEYKFRNLPSDIWNMLKEPNSFAQHRLSFLPRGGAELMVGKDDFGRKRNLGQQIVDFVKAVMPIPAQGLTAEGQHTWFGKYVAPMFGISESKYRTEAGALAHQYAIGSLPQDVTSHHVTEMVRDIESGNFDPEKVGTYIREGKINPKDVREAFKLARMPELYRDYYRLPVEQKAKVYEAATPKERAILKRFAKRDLDTTRLLPEQRAEFMQHYAEQ